MNMKKKVSLLMALAMCGTIGGVYATWYYQEENGKVTANTSVPVNITGTENTGKGALTVKSNEMLIKIDDTNIDYYGELFITGDIVLQFKPGTNVHETVKDGIALEVTLSMPEFTHQFVDTDTKVEVFNLSTTKISIAGDDTAWEDDGNGVLTTTITADQIAGILTLNTAESGKSVVYLPTSTDHTAFNNALSAVQLNLSVADVAE